MLQSLEKIQTVVSDLESMIRYLNRVEPIATLSLRKKQSRFAVMISYIILYAESLGYEATFSETYDDDGVGHMKGSLHYERLAGDLNLFKDNVLCKSTEQHRKIGEKWESIGGSWGGRFNDGNHYSLAHAGKR